MKIDPKTLNLIVPVETDGGTVHIHSVPIRRETFKKYFLILSKTLNSIYAEGLHAVAGPRIASMMLQKVAAESGISDAVQLELMNEIRRLSNAVVSTPEGWQLVPLQDCVKRGFLTEDEVEEAEGFIVFFTCICHIHRKNEISAFLQPMRDMWDVSTTLSKASEYRASLPTLTETETFSPTVAASSIPG